LENSVEPGYQKKKGTDRIKIDKGGKSPQEENVSKKHLRVGKTGVPLGSKLILVKGKKEGHQVGNKGWLEVRPKSLRRGVIIALFSESYQLKKGTRSGKGTRATKKKPAILKEKKEKKRRSVGDRPKSNTRGVT